MMKTRGHKEIITASREDKLDIPSNLNSTRKCLIKKRKNINPNKENHHTLTRFEFNEHIIDNKKKGRKTPYYQEDKLVVGVEHI